VVDQLLQALLHVARMMMGIAFGIFGHSRSPAAKICAAPIQAIAEDNQRHIYSVPDIDFRLREAYA
jgi:hypothetical protein